MYNFNLGMKGLKFDHSALYGMSRLYTVLAKAPYQVDGVRSFSFWLKMGVYMDTAIKVEVYSPYQKFQFISSYYF